MTRRNPNLAPPKTPVPSSTTIRFASLVLVCLTIIVLGAVAYFTERDIVLSRDWVIHTYQVRSHLSDLQLEVMHAEGDETSSLLMPAKQPLSQSPHRSDLALQTVAELRRLTGDNPQQQQRLDSLRQILVETGSLLESQNNSNPRPRLSASERRRQKEIGAHQAQIGLILRSMQDEEESLLDQRLKSWDYLFKRNVLMLGFAFAIVTLMLGYNFRLLGREVATHEGRRRAIAHQCGLLSFDECSYPRLQDSERRRIARELHDSVGQYLAGLKINLSQLETGVRIDAQSLIRQTLELTDYAIQEVRTISHLLHPPLLEELGFLPAARWCVDEYGKRSQIKVSLFVHEPFRRLPREVEIALFRVLQESLTNVYRHAAAQSVDVRIV